jgi:hypothetical protein
MRHLAQPGVEFLDQAGRLVTTQLMIEAYTLDSYYFNGKQNWARKNLPAVARWARAPERRRLRAGSHGLTEGCADAFRIAISVYALVAIIKKKLHVSLHTLLPDTTGSSSI